MPRPRSRPTLTFVTPIVGNPSDARRSQVNEPEVESTTSVSSGQTASTPSSRQPTTQVPIEQSTAVPTGRQFAIERELSSTPFSFTREQSTFEREVSSTPFTFTGERRSTFEREVSGTPFSVVDTQVDSEMVGNEFTEEVEEAGRGNVRLRWTEDINWTFLQVMLWIYDEIALATDNSFRSRIWAQARLLFIAELREHVPGTEFFCAHITAAKMQMAWDRLKSAYKSHYNMANLQTGVGGSDPTDRWTYYDEMGQILRNDVSVHPDVTIENYDHQGQGGAFITDNRNRNREDAENEEIMAERRARRRNIHFISKQVAKEKILDPARRYAEEFIQDQVRNHATASGIQLTGEAESSETSTRNSNASTSTNNNTNTNTSATTNANNASVGDTQTTYADTISGAGRTTRRNTGSTQNRGRSGNQQENLPSTVDHQEFLSRIEGTTNNLIEAFQESRRRRREENLEMMNHMLSNLARERRLYLGEMLNQMWAMRQGQRPNPFAGDNGRADERATSIPSTPPSNPASSLPVPSTPIPSSPIPSTLNPSSPPSPSNSIHFSPPPESFPTSVVSPSPITEDNDNTN